MSERTDFLVEGACAAIERAAEQIRLNAYYNQPDHIAVKRTELLTVATALMAGDLACSDEMPRMSFEEVIKTAVGLIDCVHNTIASRG